MEDLNRARIAVDANLLLLLIIGNLNPRFIASHRRLSHYTAQDYYLIRDFVTSFRLVVTTAHVLTEVSNLAGSATGHARESIYRQLAQTIVIVDERTVSSRSASVRSEFFIFGLTDTALCMLCSEMPLLTDDGRLADYLKRHGLDAWTLANLKTFRDQANRAG